MSLLTAWVSERDETILSLDVKKFREFYEKWQKLGVYDMPLTLSDAEIEITMRQCILGMANPPKKAKKDAQEWLVSHGMNPNPWGRK